MIRFRKKWRFRVIEDSDDLKKISVYWVWTRTPQKSIVQLKIELEIDLFG